MRSSAASQRARSEVIFSSFGLLLHPTESMDVRRTIASSLTICLAFLQTAIKLQVSVRSPLVMKPMRD